MNDVLCYHVRFLFFPHTIKRATDTDNRNGLGFLALLKKNILLYISLVKVLQHRQSTAAFLSRITAHITDSA